MGYINPGIFLLSPIFDYGRAVFDCFGSSGPCLAGSPNLGLISDDRDYRCRHKPGIILFRAAPYDHEHSFHCFDAESGCGYTAGRR